MNRPITNNTMDDDYDLLDFAMGLERQTIPLLHSNRSTDIVSLNNNRSENNHANTGNHVNRANSGTHVVNNTNNGNLSSSNISNLAVANNGNSATADTDIYALPNYTTVSFATPRLPRYRATYGYEYRLPAPVPIPSRIPASQRPHDLRRSQETTVMTITGESDTEAEDDEEEDNQEEERGQIPLVALEDGETDFEAFSMEIEETLPEDREISLDDNFALENVTLDNYYALQRTRITLPKAYVAENYFYDDTKCKLCSDDVKQKCIKCATCCKNICCDCVLGLVSTRLHAASTFDSVTKFQYDYPELLNYFGSLTLLQNVTGSDFFVSSVHQLLQSVRGSSVDCPYCRGCLADRSTLFYACTEEGNKSVHRFYKELIVVLEKNFKLCDTTLRLKDKQLVLAKKVVKEQKQEIKTLKRQIRETETDHNKRYRKYVDTMADTNKLLINLQNKVARLEKELEAKNKCLLEQPVRPPMSPIPNRSNTSPLNYVDEGGACGTGQLNLAASRYRSKYRRSNSSNTTTSSSSNNTNEKEYSRK